MYKTVIDAVNESLKEINNIPIIFEENMTGKPALMDPWIRTTIVPSEPTQISRGEDRILQYSSLVQIDIFNPKGSGSTQSNVDDVIHHFNNKLNRYLTNDPEMQLTVLRAWRGTSTIEQNWYKTIVFIRLQWFSE